MTFKEYIYTVLDTANKGQTNRAHEVGERLVGSWITRYRNLLIAQDFNRSGVVDASVEQDLGCLTLTKADASMCSTYCWGESVYWVDLPAPLELPNNAGITFFGLVDKQTRIPISEFSYGSYAQFNRFVPKKKLYAEMIGTRVFVHNVDDFFPLEGVNARGVWSDPTNLVTTSSPETPILCFDKDKDQYPMYSNLDGVLFDMIYSKELNLVRSAVTDKRDDDTSEEAL